jgi:DNA-binding transcriptional LysR family regulator
MAANAESGIPRPAEELAPVPDLAEPSAIELRHLRYFLAVFEELHFGHAAERLRIARPALSQAIRKLEHALGVQLFARTSRLVAPTPAGRALEEGARAVLLSFGRAVADAREAGGATAVVRVGCVPDLSVDRLLRFTAEVQKADPSVELQVADLSGLEQTKRLRRGELDLGIFYEGTDIKGLETEPLFQGESMAAYFRSDHRLASKRVLTPADLRAETLIVGPRSASPAVFDRWMADARELGYEWKAFVEAGGGTIRDLFLALVESGGVTFAKTSAKEDPTARVLELEARALDPPLWLPSTQLAWLAAPARSLRTVIGTAQKVARELRDVGQ